MLKKPLLIITAAINKTWTWGFLTMLTEFETSTNKVRQNTLTKNVSNGIDYSDWLL